MMKKIMWIISCIALLGTLGVLPFMPDTVPMHYDISGNIDRWGSKYENLIFPLVIILNVAFWTFMINRYEKKAGIAAGVEIPRIMNTSGDVVASGSKDLSEYTGNKEVAGAVTNARVFGIVGVTMSAVFAFMQGIILYGEYTVTNTNAVTQTVDIGRIGIILIGVMMIILGNVMTKTRTNRYVGVRVKWSMYNDNTWRKSNRFGAVAFMIAGALIIILSLLLNENSVLAKVCPAVVIATAVIAVIYSYIVYNREIREGR